MTTLYLVRHGETDWNRQKRLQGQEDIPLNELGGIHLKNEYWDAIVASPLSRAYETAEIIQSHLEQTVSIHTIDEFKERAFGEASGLTFQELHEKYPNRNYSGQEEWEDFKTRVFSGLEQIQTNFKGKKILLVAHGAVINCMLSVLSNGEVGSGKTKLINACISHLENIDDMWNIRSYNETSHLSQFQSH
ncbi:histidine phosphatase family protein [Pontibacillus sp. HMF3514]|nr:histidine phosphatase family protein [Pontibacillus sp. HMF3514]